MLLCRLLNVFYFAAAYQRLQHTVFAVFYYKEYILLEKNCSMSVVK